MKLRGLIKKYFLYAGIVFAIALLVGILISIFKNDSFSGTINYEINKGQFFIKILVRNCVIVLVSYVLVIFIKKFTYSIIAFNGLALGIIIGKTLINSAGLLWLIIPHGIFEIPNILAIGYIIEKGENFIRNNTRSFWKVLAIHEGYTVFCAIIEAFVTPLFLGMVKSL